MADEVLYEQRGRIAVITLNRPDKLNALNIAMFEGLARAWARFNDDDDAGVAILTGSGRAFSAGVDLRMVSESAGRASPSSREGMVSDTIVTPRTLGIFKPTIAAVNGYALAGGFLMAMDCHLCIAAENAEFGIPATRWNLPEPWQVDIARHLKMRHIIEATIVPWRISAQRAYEMGFVNWVVPREQLMDKALAVAEAILENGPGAPRTYIETFYRTYNLSYETASALANHIQRRL